MNNLLAQSHIPDHLTSKSKLNIPCALGESEKPNEKKTLPMERVFSSLADRKYID
jgi:hypothetical protein